MAENGPPHLNGGQIVDFDKLPASDAAVLHFQSCAECRERVADWREMRALIAPAANAMDDLGLEGECPSPEDLANYAAAGEEGAHSDSIAAHVILCRRCAAILQDSLDDTESGQQPALPLQSSGTAWRRKFDRGVVTGNQPALAHWWKFAAAATVLLAVAGSVVFWRIHATNPALLLARAYTETRPFDYRLPDAGYAPPRLTRGTGSVLGRPESLDQAALTIRRIVAAQPRSPCALVLKGRLELLANEKEHDSAIQTLESAAQLNEHNADALTDLAVAYAVRGDSEQRNRDYGQAMDLLLRALKEKPADPRIQYNLALVYEKLSMVDEAIETWHKFLGSHPSEGWRNEAISHLAKLEKIKAEKKHANERFLPDPGRFLASYVAGEAFDPLPLYEVFWTEWLPRAAFDAMAAKAARLTASAFTKFGEYSLLETLDAHPSSAKDSAVALLAKAISLNRGGHPGEALAPARAAALAFDSARMPAAAAVARGEIIYAARWADLYRECKQTEEVLLKSLGPRYPWTEGNARLDHASCLLRMGEEGPARIEIEKARRHLNAAHLWPLALRASQYVAGIDAEIGNYGAVWDTASNGLRFYWANPASIYRAEAFQFILQQACSGSGWMECAQVFYRATIRSAHEAGNAEMEVANRSRLAELLQQLGDYSGEMHELDELKRLLDGLGQTQDVRTLRWEAALHRIEADLATNSARDPLPELDRLAAGASAREAMQRIALEQDRGLAFQARGNFARAAQSFTRAIELNGELAQSAGSWLLRIPATETVASSYRNLTLIQLMQEHDPVSALATWRQFRPNCTRAPQSVTMAVLRDEVVVWAGDGQATKARRVEQPVQELRRLSGEFLSLCSSPQSNTAEIRRIGHQLYGALLDREVRTLHSGTVSLSTDSWLSQIPFVALTDDSGKYLRSRFQFVQGFGPPANPAPATIAIGSTAFIVSAPVAVAPGQLRLPFLSAAEREAEDVAKRFSHAVVSGDATPSWLAENIPRADVFHFSGHGWSNGGNGALILPAGPNLEPRFITSGDLARQNWSRCQLAVLSACLTASGETRGVVNNQSLVQALLSAGARRVIAARWSIDSEATRALMESFYARLASGKTVPEALFGAEADVAAVPNWSHPYYWAGFDVFGAA